ncbi:MAG: ComEC/Rec2 family competence protein [Deltaproteobacteria bacterium]|nr:ComEC/Rec2 family competence protein [Deltaproteobacteria bacterium]
MSIGHPTGVLVMPLLALLAGQAMAVMADVAGAWPFTALLAASSLALCFVRPRWGLLGLVCAVAFHWGFAAHHVLLHPRLPAHHIQHLTEREGAVLVEGRLYREPEGQGGRSRWHLAVEGEWTPEGARRATGNVRVTVRNAYRHWRHGDVIRAPLRPRAPKNWDERFDYAAYLARREIYHVAYLHNDWDVRLVRREGGGVRGWIETGRRRIGRFLERVFEPDTGALLKALVVGDRGGLAPETRDRFVAVGMSHVLSISGLHVGMLSLAVYFLCRALAGRSTWLLLRLPVHKLAALGSLAPVLLYAAVAGARIPTVRAAIMIGLYQLAVLSGRNASLFRSLALAALIAALVWPGAVMEASFQLSFLAVLSIAGGIRIFRGTSFMQPTEAPREGLLQRYRPAILLAVLVPVFATVGTGPIVAHHFGILSLAGFIANPLLVPLVGFFIVPAGLLTGFLCLFAPAVSTLLARAVEPVAALFLWSVDLLAGVPMAAFSLPRPGWAMVGASYVFIVIVAACVYRFLQRTL